MCDEDSGEAVDERREWSRGGVGQGEPGKDDTGDDCADFDCGVTGSTRCCSTSERVLLGCGVEKGDRGRCTCWGDEWLLEEVGVRGGSRPLPPERCLLWFVSGDEEAEECDDVVRRAIGAPNKPPPLRLLGESVDKVSEERMAGREEAEEGEDVCCSFRCDPGESG